MKNLKNFENYSNDKEIFDKWLDRLELNTHIGYDRSGSDLLVLHYDRGVATLYRENGILDIEEASKYRLNIDFEDVQRVDDIVSRKGVRHEYLTR